MESREPHALSLKVLRLSRPSLAQQQPLPPSSSINPRAALSLPGESIDDAFTLTPLLTLPEAFGSVYIGEGFECILCINNELPDPTSRRVTSAKIAATMQTPTTSIPLDLSPPNDDAALHGLPTGGSVQTVLRCDIREEGAFQLAVSITYNESLQAPASSAAAGGRVRSFRKLYNFVALPALSVRTKSTALAARADDRRERYALECQLENLADGVLTVERLHFEAAAVFEAASANWDEGHVVVPVLNPREVTQVAFLISERPVEQWGGAQKELTRDGRTILGSLTIHWRTAMGQSAVLSTGWLTSRKR